MAQPALTNLNQVTKWIREFIASGASISFGKRHADDEMRKDGISRADVFSVLKKTGRVVEAQGRSVRGSGWRYKAQGTALDGSRIVVIVEIEFQTGKLTVVTVWKVTRI
jgi:hypothetical protein